MQNNEKIHVLATSFIIKDLVDDIAEDLVDTISLIPADVDPHAYELVKMDKDILDRADLVFCHGLGCERGASLLYYLQNEKKVVDIGKILITNNKDKAIFIDKEIDPHIWMDISLWAKAIDIVADKLIEKLPLKKNEIIKRKESVKKRYYEVHSEILAAFQKVPKEKRRLVTSNDAFQYFVRTYFQKEDWHNSFCSIEGLNRHLPITMFDLQKAMAFLKQHGIHSFFIDVASNDKIISKLQVMAKREDFPISLCTKPLCGDTIDASIKGYLPMMKYNCETIIENLR
jgi:manganese/zinc/iron transport system substrate-binding protein